MAGALPRTAPGQYPLGRLFLLMLAGAAALGTVRGLGWASILVAVAAIWLWFFRRPRHAWFGRLLSATRSRGGWLRGVLLAAYLVLFAVLLFDSLLRAIGTKP